VRAKFTKSLKKLPFILILGCVSLVCSKTQPRDINLAGCGLLFTGLNNTAGVQLTALALYLRLCFCQVSS
jgi:hypothetical protein